VANEAVSTRAADVSMAALVNIKNLYAVGTKILLNLSKVRRPKLSMGDIHFSQGAWEDLLL